MAENAIEVQEKPILFSGAMVRAVIEGRKTQTRRIVKGTALGMLVDGFTASYVADPGNSSWCPYGKQGDRLWVRESSRVEECKYGDNAGIFNVYLADNALLPVPSVNDHAAQEAIDNWWRKHLNGKNIPSIFMPRWASRLTLEIVSVKVERVQEISEADAITEGVERNCPNWNDAEKIKGCPACAPSGICQAKDEFIHEGLGECDFPVTAKEAFQYLWDSINEKRGFGWKANPWTWAIQFKRLP